MQPNADTHLTAADRFSRIWTVVGYSFAALFFGIGLILLVRELRFEQAGLRAVGSVVDVRASENAEGTNYTPVVEFTVPDGQAVKFEGLSTSPPPVRGEMVPIIYSRSDPHNARIDRFLDRWAFPCGFTTIGVLLALGAWLSRRWPRGGRSADAPNHDMGQT
jgi:hypothetical protein